MHDARLENIESKLAYQEDLLDELNKTVYRQQLELSRLESLCTALARQIQTMAESGADARTAHERPPHY